MREWSKVILPVLLGACTKPPRLQLRVPDPPPLFWLLYHKVLLSVALLRSPVAVLVFATVTPLSKQDTVQDEARDSEVDD